MLEDAFKGIFPHLRCRPFGSTANGFGRYNSDVDLDLYFIDDQGPTRKKDSGFVFSYKPHQKFKRNLLDIIGLTVRHAFPECFNVNFSNNNRKEKLVQFHNPFGFYHVSCDNLYGPVLTKAIYTCATLDNRIQPLVFAVQFWAKRIGLTSDTRGDQFSDFQLLILVFVYLQISSKILPEFSRISSTFRAPELCMPEQKVLDELARKAALDRSSLSDLLAGFFDYYAGLQLGKRAFSLYYGKYIKQNKPSAAISIRNPCNPEVNITKNVSNDALYRFQDACRQAANKFRGQKGEECSLLHLCSAVSLKLKPQPVEIKFKQNARIQADPPIFSDFKQERIEFAPDPDPESVSDEKTAAESTPIVSQEPTNKLEEFHYEESAELQPALDHHQFPAEELESDLPEQTISELLSPEEEKEEVVEFEEPTTSEVKSAPKLTDAAQTSDRDLLRLLRRAASRTHKDNTQKEEKDANPWGFSAPVDIRDSSTRNNNHNDSLPSLSDSVASNQQDSPLSTEPLEPTEPSNSDNTDSKKETDKICHEIPTAQKQGLGL